MQKKIKDLVKGDKIRFEFGDYDNWVTWTFDHYKVNESQGYVSIYGIPKYSDRLDNCCHFGTIEDIIEVVDPVAEHCGKCGKPLCVSDNKNYYRKRAFCDECVKGSN